MQILFTLGINNTFAWLKIQEIQKRYVLQATTVASGLCGELVDPVPCVPLELGQVSNPPR